MATLEFQFYSKALKKVTTANVILPEIHKTKEGVGNPGNTYKTLYLLHGLSGDHTNWLRKTSIERYANEYGIAVVMPDVGRSWYTDTAYGEKYFTFVAEELPAVCRSYFKGMSDKREDNLIAGLSMGGYGAMKIALRCPDTFGGCASLSGAFDIFAAKRRKMCDDWQGLFGFDLKEPEQLCGTEHDVFALVHKNKEAGVPFPKLYLWCGESDALLPHNQKMRDLLTQQEIPHLYEES